MRKSLFLIPVILLFFVPIVRAQHEDLRMQIDQIAKSCHGKVGVAIDLLEKRDTIAYHNTDRYVLQSVFKLAIGMKMLLEIDKGTFKMDQKIHIAKIDLPPTYSPLRDKYPEGNFYISIEELMDYMIVLSDNNACDILLKQLGGTKPVENFVHNLGISNFEMKASEAEMASAWKVQYNNWCQPTSQIELMKLIFTGHLLSKTSVNYLQKAMLNTSVTPHRIKGLLPLGTLAGHRSGTSSTNKQGLTAANNDVGFIIMPNGNHLLISIFISDCTDQSETRDLIIARIAKAAYNEFAKQ